MNTFRIKIQNLTAVLANIPGSKLADHFPRSFAGGCLDPDHCSQHPGWHLDGSKMVAVTVPLSGNQFHKKLVALNLLDKRWDPHAN